MGLFGLAAIGVGLYTGFKMVGKLFGSDPDFTQAWMLNMATGQGGFFKTFFQDGLSSMFLGSRTASAMYGSMGMPLGSSLFAGPMMMNPYMMNPYMMGQLPYPPVGLGARLWC